MNQPFVHSLKLHQFGCFDDAALKFTPLHALVGPNDSGKSTVLRALMAGKETYYWEYRRSAESRFDIEVATGSLTVQANERVWETFSVEENKLVGLTKCLLLRLDPDSLRIPTPLIDDKSPFQLIDTKGRGLPSLYDALTSRNLRGFISINAQFQQLFPSVDQITLKNPNGNTKSLGVTLKNGTFIPPERMSEGMLYFLAYAILPYLSQPNLLLIEEPENGLHPARIKEVMRILREISKTTQVLLTTHSPLVVNELEGHEVSVLTRHPETGTSVRLLSDTFNYAQRSRIYANGELWVSHCDGEQETELIDGPAHL